MQTSIDDIAEHIVKNARWKPDLGGKQDFDFPLISSSCRYYDDNTAYVSILLYLDGDNQGDYITLATTEVKGGTEAETKAAAETWLREQAAKVVACSLTAFDISPAESARVDKHINSSK